MGLSILLEDKSDVAVKLSSLAAAMEISKLLLTGSW